MASIIVTAGQQQGDYYPLGKRTNVIGRAESVPIQILDDLVSRKHMQIRFEEVTNRYYVFDMKSKHGVFVNGRRISDETVLADGDQIMIGQTTLLFTEKDFEDRESAFSHYKKVGERSYPTRLDEGTSASGNTQRYLRPDS